MAGPEDVRTETRLAHLRWWDGRAWGACLALAYLTLIGLPAVLAWGHPPDFELSPEAWGGYLCGLVGFAMLCLQPVLAGRFRLIERPFGLDRMLCVHKAMALVGLSILLVHPLLLGLDLGWGYVFGGDGNWRIGVGKVAFGILVLGLAHVVLLVFWPRHHQVWRLLHRALVLVVIFAFLHGLLLYSVMLRGPVLWYWIAIFVVGMTAFALSNLMVPLAGRWALRVAAVDQVSHDTWRLTLSGPDRGRLRPWRPGQFMFLRLVRPGRRSEEHPFTISAAPTEGRLQATIKESGDFTATIGETRVGDGALVDYPYGRFSYVHHRAQSFVFIAGGVGITPIRSMLRTLADTGDERPAALIYGNKTEADILFREELAGLPDHVRVVHVLSEPDDGWEGETGYVSADLLHRHAGDLLATAAVYLCGPPPMLAMIRTVLEEMGVPPRRIHFERFSI